MELTIDCSVNFRTEFRKKLFRSVFLDLKEDVSCNCYIGFFFEEYENRVVQKKSFWHDVKTESQFVRSTYSERNKEHLADVKSFIESLGLLYEYSIKEGEIKYLGIFKTVRKLEYLTVKIPCQKAIELVSQTGNGGIARKDYFKSHEVVKSISEKLINRIVLDTETKNDEWDRFRYRIWADTKQVLITNELSNDSNVFANGYRKYTYGYRIVEPFSSYGYSEMKSNEDAHALAWAISEVVLLELKNRLPNICELCLQYFYDEDCIESRWREPHNYSITFCIPLKNKVFLNSWD